VSSTDPVRVLVIGDPYMPSSAYAEPLAGLGDIDRQIQHVMYRSKSRGVLRNDVASIEDALISPASPSPKYLDGRIDVYRWYLNWTFWPG